MDKKSYVFSLSLHHPLPWLTISSFINPSGKRNLQSKIRNHPLEAGVEVRARVEAEAPAEVDLDLHQEVVLHLVLVLVHAEVQDLAQVLIHLAPDPGTSHPPNIK